MKLGYAEEYARRVVPANITSGQVWRELEKHSFAVLAYVTPRGEARTTGVVYAVRERHLYITTASNSWKARHIASNAHVSLTVTIAKRIPFVPWIQIPAATISFAGEASVHGLDEVPPEIPRMLLRGLQLGPEDRRAISVIKIRPVGEFLTYGVGVPMPVMRRPQDAKGRAAV